MEERITEILKMLEELYNFGVKMNADDLEVEEMLAEMYLPKRKSNTYVPNKNVLIELIENYDMTQFNVGGVSFYDSDSFVDSDEFVVIGTDGAGDYIAEDKLKGNVYNAIDGFLKVKVANSSEQFLKNLIEIGKFNLSNEINTDEYHNLLNTVSFDKESREFYFSLIKS